MSEAVHIDGSRGEGGGQILRTSLALSMITGRPLVMSNIRAGRAKPGLRRQHLACVEAAAQVCSATVHGASVGSKYIEFTPPERWPPSETEMVIDIGTMGSTTLVVQTILLPTIVANRALRVTIRGGTHNPMAPPFEFVERVFLHHLRAMGASAEVSLDRYGFVEGGGDRRGKEARPPLGQLTLVVNERPNPGDRALHPIEIVDAPPITSRHATAVLARLPTHVADRELAVVVDRLGFSRAECEVREVPDGGPANVLMIEIERGDWRELVTGYGEKGTRAEVVAGRACDEVERYLAANVPAGEHLADQLLLPMALAGGGRFRCAPLSLHATTNIETIQRFLDIPIVVAPDGDAVIVSVG